MEREEPIQRSEHADPSDGRASLAPLPPSVRRQVLSQTRIKVAFIIVTLTLLGAFAATMVVSVDRIFDWLTPVASKDLHWKTQRGVAELRRTADVGIVLRDKMLIRRSAADYEADDEVRLVVVLDAQGQLLYQHAKGGASPALLFRQPPNRVSEQQGHLWSWTPVEMEGERIGQLGLAVSTARLRAGEKLRAQILKTALGACLVGIGLSLAFVSFYVGPLISATKQAFLDLERKTVEALESTRVKSEFLANMSHEIRTPLNGVIGMLGLLVRGDLNPRQRRRAEISESSARSLLTLISDVLDFSKMESGHHVLHLADCDLHSLVRNRVELLAVKAHAKQLEIAYRIAADVPHIVQVDADRLTQVLTNLVGNAVKFTQEGEVAIAVSSPQVADGGTDTRLRFEVSDTGPGIEPGDLQRLFKSFSQVDASTTRAHEGTGLGLAISKHLVGLMGGEIGVDSKPGAGSTFWFTIRCMAVERAASALPAPASPAARRVLIVDPSSMYRGVLAEYMSQWKMKATLAATAAEALALAREAQAAGEPFDFAIVDLRLQDEGGGSLTQALIRQCGSALSVIQLTPALWTPPENQAPDTSIFLTKPVRASDLYDCIVTRTTQTTGAQHRGRTHLAKLGSRRGHILVVDDNEVNRVLAEELLRELQHTCDLAASGQEAVEHASARVYDAILMDCQMPGMNGYQTTHEIREREGNAKRRTPIIALTAHAFTGEAQKVKAAGMDDFLTKPVTPQVLDATLQKWMAIAATGRIRSLAAAGTEERSQRVELLDSAPANDAEISISGDDPALDEPVLIDVRRSPRLLQTFLRTVPVQVTALLQTSSTGDIPATRAHAHKLKGSASSIGALRVSKLCEAIQLAADRGEVEHLAAWSTLVAKAMLDLNVKLEAELHIKQAES
jgi:signal transduction histidine kinase/DNA-binding response OmpR family regulator/HPt (histidine-containing phosphotransfer) domain-containing protein